MCGSMLVIGVVLVSGLSITLSSVTSSLKVEVRFLSCQKVFQTLNHCSTKKLSRLFYFCFCSFKFQILHF
uniref:Putative secreted peptide n=1 Tax=Anopheles braziliensis TaxID=58242 RepID=A0A2M3ZQ39_9DIPT